MMTQILLVRHGESEANAAKQIAGDSLSPLSDRGRFQASKLRDYLSKFHFDVAISSDRPRAFDTALAIINEHRLDLQTSLLLRERNWGELAVKQAEEYQHQLAESGNTFYEFTPAGGESFIELEGRIKQFLQLLSENHRGNNILVVAHESVNKIMLKVLLNLSWAEFQKLEQPNACVNILKINEARSVKADSVGYVEHLV